MDLIKTLLVYMMLVVGSAAESAPAVTPPPADQPTYTPSWSFVTTVPTAVPTAVPTLAPTATPTVYTTLYVGDRGEEVRKLQRRLAELNYLTGSIDGIYGQVTKRAVERFQYYNDLTVDGIAGKATQRKLFEDPNVVYAPPDITPVPTPTATAMLGVTVPVYYVDQNGLLLKRVDLTCYGTSTIYANSSNVPAGYTLTSASAVTVTVRNGVASPASVTFRYQQAATPTEAPTTVIVPVYYMTDTGAILYQTTATLSRNAVTNVPVNLNLVPSYYRLTSATTVSVTVNAQGTPSPASVIFTFTNATPTPVPETKKVQIPVRYVNEQGFLLNEASITVEYGQSAVVYANASLVQADYRLISQNPVSVSVSAYGTANPAVVIFTYTYIAPTSVPTQAPTAIPTAVPTMIPTLVPTAIPTAVPTAVPTAIPTAIPTMIPTPVPTAIPTMIPTAIPTAVPTMIPTPVPTAVPTEVPTPIPTEVPTPIPTEVPTPVPTEVPTPVPTEIPTPIPTEIPTPVPTEAPTPTPTEVPTPVPTETPAPVPTEAPKSELTPAGSHVGLKGLSYDLTWFRDANNTPFVSLKELAKQVGWIYYGNGGSTLLGHGVYVAYSSGGISSLTVDEKDCSRFAIVWEDDLYVNADFLKALGLRATAQNDWLLLESIE